MVRKEFYEFTSDRRECINIHSTHLSRQTFSFSMPTDETLAGYNKVLIQVYLLQACLCSFQMVAYQYCP